MYKMQRFCPICDSEESEELTQIYNIEQNLKLPKKQMVLACCNCGFVYNSFKETQEDFNSYYNDLSAYGMSYSYGGQETKIYEKDGRIIDFIKDKINKNSEILDIGCAKGSLLMKLKQNGYKNIYGIEPSGKCFEFLQNNGIKSINDDIFTENDDFKGKFDLILVTHVLEHIVDLKKAILNMKTMLNKNGMIYIEVPNADKYIDISKEFTPYFFLPCEHVNHFSMDSFCNFEHFGFKIIKKDDNQFESENINVPIISLILKNTVDNTCSIKYYDKPSKNLTQYIEDSRQRLKTNLIKQLEESQQKVILWGLGATTSHIVSKGFDKCNVVLAIDSNPSKNGHSLVFGDEKLIKITTPPEVIDEEAIIVILPYLQRDNILKQIKSLNYLNKTLIYTQSDEY